MDSVLKVFTSVSIMLLLVLLSMISVRSLADTPPDQVVLTDYMSDLNGNSQAYTFAVPTADPTNCNEAADPEECRLQLEAQPQPVDSVATSPYTEAMMGMSRVLDGFA